jgi:glycosyltransferase involved in cell wall biosynthesis
MRICFLGALCYETDPRTMRYASALHQCGHEVDVIGIGKPGSLPLEDLDGVRLIRVQRRERNEKGPASYLGKLLLFLLRSMVRLAREHARRPYDLIHVHSIPDFEVFAAWYPRLTGARVILDIYDVSPEFYLSKFTTTRDSFGYRGLLRVEKWSCRFADHVIAANHLWRELLIRRSVPAAKCSVFVNFIDCSVFRRHPRTRNDERFITVYPGVLNWHQGLDIAVRAFARVKEQLPHAEFHIYGEGNQKDALLQLTEDLGLNGSVFIHPVVPLKAVPAILANADVGVVAKRADVFGNEAYSTKILEYMSQGIPAVIPRTKIDAFYFNDSVVRFFEPENHEGMAREILALAQDRALRTRLVENAFRYMEDYDWQKRSADYARLVAQLVEVRNGGSVTPVA